MSTAIMKTKNIILGSATSSFTSHNLNYVICKSLKASSAETKCSLPSTLVNFKSISSITLSGPSGFTGYTDIYLNLDSEYTVPGNFLPKALPKTIHMEGQGYFLLNGNSVIESNLVSANIPNGNKLEAIIPPSSCFNLTLSETITTVNIPFTAQGSLISEDTGVFLSTATLSGTLIAVSLGADYSEISPCQ